MKKQNFKSISSDIQDISQQIKTTFPLQLRYVLGVYFLLLLFTLLYRVFNFAIHCFISFNDVNLLLLLRSLLIGIKFDTVVLCWILSPFLLFMIVGAVFKIEKKWFYRTVHLLLFIVCAVVLFVCAADIAYFLYFSSHINIIALSWLQSFAYFKTVLNHHPASLLFGTTFLLSLAWFAWLMYCLYNATLFKLIPPYKSVQPTPKVIIFSLILSILCCWGMYGRINPKKPLSISSAYFCDNVYFNQLAVSPIFNLYKSVQEETSSETKLLSVVSGIQAKNIVEQEFLLKNDNNFIQPELSDNANIVMFILDNINSNDLKNMPFLSSVSKKSYNFTSVYSDGENGYNAVFSTLFAYPNIFSANSMNTTVVPKMPSVQQVFKGHGYLTYYFQDEGKQAENTVRFLYRNDFDYSSLGKHSQRENIYEKLDASQRKFFSVITTPSYSEKDNARKIDKYLKDFIQLSKKHSWSSNTVYVFVGNTAKDSPIPFIIYNPNETKRRITDNIGSQTDIMPTLCAMVFKDYRNEDILGLNIFSQQRTYTITSYSNKLIVQNKEWKYILEDKGNEYLYHTNDNNEIESCLHSQAEQAENMKKYAFSMLQVTQYRISNLRMEHK